jgi:hypothetical protein
VRHNFVALNMEKKSPPLKSPPLNLFILRLVVFIIKSGVVIFTLYAAIKAFSHIKLLYGELVTDIAIGMFLIIAVISVFKSSKKEK